MSDFFAFKTAVVLSIISIALVWALGELAKHQETPALRIRYYRGTEVPNTGSVPSARILPARAEINIARPVYRGHPVVEVPCRIIEAPAAGRFHRGLPVEESPVEGQKFTSSPSGPGTNIEECHPR